MVYPRISKILIKISFNATSQKDFKQESLSSYMTGVADMNGVSKNLENLNLDFFQCHISKRF